MNISMFFTNLFNRKSRIQLLEEEIADMKKRIFKEKTNRGIDYLISSSWLGYMWREKSEVKPLEEDFFDNLEELENKIDLISKYLKIEIKKKPSEGEKLIIKKIKK